MYVAKRTMLINGVSYQPGNSIPSDQLTDARAKIFFEKGWLGAVEKQEGFIQETKLQIPVTNKEGEVVTIELTEGEVYEVFDLLQTSIPNLEAKLTETTNINVLAVADGTDSRKGAKELFVKRVKTLIEEQAKNTNEEQNERDTESVEDMKAGSDAESVNDEQAGSDTEPVKDKQAGEGDA